MASLIPPNNPEVESLPIVDLKIGDEVVLIWAKSQKIWKVKAFCEDGDVDIFLENVKCAAMSVPYSELRLAELVGGAK